MRRVIRCIAVSLAVSLSAGLALLLIGTHVVAASVSQGYHSSKNLTVGTVVSVKPNGTEVEPTTINNEKSLVGVVVSSTDVIIDLQPHGSDVRVGLDGQVSVLVSDISGDIKAGDNLVISPLSGVAARDTPDVSAKKYIAVASQDFTKKSVSARTVPIKFSDGSDQEVSVGAIRAKINLIDRPADAKAKNENFFVALASKIIGKTVNRTQLLAATAVFLATFLVTGFVLYGSIRGSFVALGRNPLSKSVIVSNLFKIIALGLLILEIGAAAAYVILVL